MIGNIGSGAAHLMGVGLKLLRFVLPKQKQNSLIRVSQAARVEPIALVDQRLLPKEYLKDIMHSGVSIFVAAYLQAFALTGNIGRINTLRLLDSLNPSRKEVDMLRAGTEVLMKSMESVSLTSDAAFNGMLPSMENISTINQQIQRNLNSPANPTYDRVAEYQTEEIEYDKQGQPILRDDGTYATGIKKHLGTTTDHSLQGPRVGGEKLNALVNEQVNLSVGKIFEVTIEDQGKSATIPVSVRLISSVVQPSILSHILSDGVKNRTAGERYHAWRSGQLGSIADIVTCKDLVSEHRKALMKDTTGNYAEMTLRRRKASRAQLAGNGPSLATASNIAVISKQTARELEAALGGKLSDYKTRQKMFESSYLMLLFVVDTDYEQVTVYHDTIRLPTELSVRELKSSNKGSGPDVGELLKAYTLGANPTL